MALESITCPHCRHTVELNEVLTHDIRESIIRELRPKIEQRQRDLDKREQELVQKTQSVDQIVAERIRAQTKSIEADALRRAKEATDQELLKLEAQLQNQEKTIRESREREKTHYQKELELQAKIEAQDVEISRAVNQKTAEIRERMEHQARLKEIEHETTRQSLQLQVDQLQKKLEQGSMQLQGEALELDLEAMLRATFPQDTIEEVGKGIKGGDCIQKVYNGLGVHAGTILWEVKRTKQFSEPWVQKLKDDMISAKCEIGIIMSSAMPKEFSTFGEMNGVWVTNYSCMLGLTAALRSQLINVANQRQIQQGKQTKADLLYDFVSSSEFVQRIESILNPFLEMQDALNQEKRAMTKIWSQREKQLQRVLDNISGLTGSLSGITGKSLEIDAFELKALPSMTD